MNLLEWKYLKMDDFFCSLNNWKALNWISEKFKSQTTNETKNKMFSIILIKIEHPTVIKIFMYIVSIELAEMIIKSECR